MRMQRAIIMMSAASLCACASLPKTNKPADSAQGAAQSIQSLSPQTLEKGECGLFVWTSDIEKRFVLFSQSQKPRAVWVSPSGEIELSVSKRSGVPKQGEYPNQSFVTASADTLELNLLRPDPISNGTRYRTGTLTDKDGNGWSRVTPVVGLSVCKPVN